jgi:hypothetical protein
MDVVEGGLGYHVKEKLNGGKENFYLVPPNNRHIKSINPVGITMPWLYGDTFYPWL